MSKTKTYKPRGQPILEQTNLRNKFRLINNNKFKKHSCLIIGEPETLYPAVVFTTCETTNGKENIPIDGKTYINNGRELINSKFITLKSNMNISDRVLKKAAEKAKDLKYKDHIANNSLLI